MTEVKEGGGGGGGGKEVEEERWGREGVNRSPSSSWWVWGCGRSRTLSTSSR